MTLIILAVMLVSLILISTEHFTNINKELEKNIRELDQPIFDLVNRHVATSSNRMNALSGLVSTTQLEGLTKSQQILMSEMKHNAQAAIHQATDFLTQIGEQRVLTNKVLISQLEDNSQKTCHIPVIISETVSDAQQNVRTEISVPEGLTNNEASRVTGVIRSQNDLPWNKGEVSPLVGDEFARLLDESNASPRVKELISPSTIVVRSAIRPPKQVELCLIAVRRQRLLT